VNWQRLTLIVIAAYCVVTVVLGTIALHHDQTQTDRIDRTQDEIQQQQIISRAAICEAAKVIGQEPQGSPATGQGETLRDFHHRLRTYKAFIAGAEVLKCGQARHELEALVAANP